MKPRSFNYASNTVTTDLPSGSSVVTRNLSFSDKLDIIQESVDGDYKSPNPHEFGVEEIYGFKGQILRFDPVGAGGQPNQLIEGCLPVSTLPLPGNLQLVSANTYNACLSDLSEKIRGGVDLSVDLAQAGQVSSMMKDTVRLVRNIKSFPVRGLREAYKQFRSDPESATKSYASGAGSKWLEFQYGWKPLASSIWDTAYQLMGGMPNLLTVSARAKDVDEYDTKYRFHSDSLWDVPANVRRSERVEIKCRFVLDPDAISYLSNFTSLNPASIAWELTPYSFVVDWFVDVGGYLRNLETACLYASAFKDGYVTYGVSTRTKCDRASGTGSDGYYTYNYQVGGAKSYYGYKRRALLANMPFPRPPQFKAELGSGRLLNAAALLSQHLKSGKGWKAF